MAKESAVKIRIPRGMKAAVKLYADSKLTSESAIFREAMIEYMAARKQPMTLDAAADPAPVKPVHYRKRAKKTNSSSKTGIDRKMAEIIRQGTSGSKPGGAAPPGAKP